jgi:AraC-like DNA-binding protein
MLKVQPPQRQGDACGCTNSAPRGAEVTLPAGWRLTDQIGLYTDILRDSYLPFAVSAAPGVIQPFSASVRDLPLGEMRWVEGLSSPHRGTRAAREVSATPRDVVGLQFVVTGRQLVAQGAEVLELRAGDMMVWDSDTIATYEITATIRKQTLVIPRDLAVSLLPRLHRPAIVHLVPRQLHNPVRALFALLTAIGDSLATNSPEATRRAVALVVQQLADLDNHDTVAPSMGRPGAQHLRKQILCYVEQNLGDPTLSPTTVAAAHYISTRTVYHVLEPLGVSLAAHIRRRRLARCYADLVTGDDPVGEIGVRWGFVNASHFTRAFTNQYGFPPGQTRRPA